MFNDDSAIVSKGDVECQIRTIGVDALECTAITQTTYPSASLGLAAFKFCWPDQEDNSTGSVSLFQKAEA